MATFTVSRTTHAIENGTAVNNGASDTGDLDLATNGYYEANFNVTFHIASGTPSGDVTISVYQSVNSTGKLETEPSFVTTIPFSATGDKRIFIGGIRCGYVRIKCENDTGENGTWDLDAEGLKQVST